MRLSREQYREIFGKLPQDIQALCTSSDVSEKIFEICEKHKLHIDEAGVVHDIIMDTAMGIIATKNMESEIINELKLNPLEVSALVREIDTEVLAPVKETMINTYRHSNPFKPQTLQHTDDLDEIDESHLDRNLLLAEIENPGKSSVKKLVTETSSKETPVAPKETSITPDIKKDDAPINNTLKSARDRMLNLFKDDKLSHVVTMNTHLQGAQEAEPKANNETKSQVATDKVASTPIAKDTGIINSEMEVSEKLVSSVGITKENSTPQIKEQLQSIAKIDPYRETI